ncbi:MAG: hypothetical protein AB9903_10945 [Vulcanimicrobiota bacterium]
MSGENAIAVDFGLNALVDSTIIGRYNYGKGMLTVATWFEWGKARWSSSR